MRVVLAAAIMALLAGSAYAQDNHVQRYGETPKEKSQQEIQAEKNAERAYKHSLGNIPDKGPVDPWGAVRSTDAAKTDTPKGDSQKTSMAKSRSKSGAAK